MSSAVITQTSTVGLSAIQATRTNKKGQTSVRDLLGLMLSGSRAERTEAASAVVSIYWQNGQFAPLAQQISRVYGKDVQAFAAAIGLDLTTGKIAADAPVQITGGNRAAYVAIVDGLNKSHAVKPFKGEKALFLQALQSHIKARAEASAPEAPALPASPAPEADSTPADASTPAPEADDAAAAAASGVTIQ